MGARETVRQHCQPGEFFCLGCRAPKRPAGNMADYIPRSATRGSLNGICPSCGKMIYRAVSLVKIEEIGGGLGIAFPKAEQRLARASKIARFDSHGASILTWSNPPASLIFVTRERDETTGPR